MTALLTAALTPWWAATTLTWALTATVMLATR